VTVVTGLQCVGGKCFWWRRLVKASSSDFKVKISRPGQLRQNPWNTGQTRFADFDALISLRTVTVPGTMQGCLNSLEKPVVRRT